MIHKKLLWAIKRHPTLYTTRFRLLSKNVAIEDIVDVNYNQSNPKEEIPSFFYSLNKVIFNNGTPQNEFDKIKVITAWFNSNIKGGPGLSLSSVKAMELMIEGKGGVCSDMVQVLNNYCVINDIKIREWGSTRIPFDKTYGGHSFNEVFCSEREKWILVDIAYGVYFEDDDANPLSVLEFFERLRKNQVIHTVLLNKGRELEKVAIDNIYFHQNVAPFLINNYSNKLYDRYLTKWAGKLPTFLIHFLVFLRGKSYYYQFPIDDYKDIFR